MERCAAGSVYPHLFQSCSGESSKYRRATPGFLTNSPIPVEDQDKILGKPICDSCYRCASRKRAAQDDLPAPAKKGQTMRSIEVQTDPPQKSIAVQTAQSLPAQPLLQDPCRGIFKRFFFFFFFFFFLKILQLNFDLEQRYRKILGEEIRARFCRRRWLPSRTQQERRTVLEITCMFRCCSLCFC